MKLTYRSTILACYNGYIMQAICINLAPLFYLTFQKEFSLSVTEISMLIALNFSCQLLVDVIATRYSKHLNLRMISVAAHVVSASGLIGMSFLPYVLPPYAGLLTAVSLLGIGGGLTEVIISPLIEACPTDGKSGNMCLLHSFYCWGQAGVVLFSGIYFAFLDIAEYWRYLPIFWAIIPLMGAVAFCMVPIYRLPGDASGKSSTRALFKNPACLGFLLMMSCGGAAELTMSQWASAFAESALGIPKELGDLFGPCMFALMMGTVRALYGKFSNVVNLRVLMEIGCVICIIAYLLAAFVPIPALSLVSCALCGIGVALFWPGVLSQASASIPMGGISMFALLAVAGDLGCLIGPSVAGSLVDLLGGDLRLAFCFTLPFPIILLVMLLLQKGRKGGKE